MSVNHMKWGVQGGARSPLVEAPQAPDLQGFNRAKAFMLRLPQR